MSRLPRSDVAAERLAVEEAQDKGAFERLVRDYIDCFYVERRAIVTPGGG